MHAVGKGDGHLVHREPVAPQPVRQLNLEAVAVGVDVVEIQVLERATVGNPFAGRVICGVCGQVFGRKVWNSTDGRLRRIICRCNGKYVTKSGKGCDSGHIDDGDLNQTFVDVFNMIVENKAYFIGKWQERLGSDNALVRFKTKQFIGIMADAEVIDEFDIDLYFALVEKMTVHEGGRLVVSLLDGTAVECELG